ncbi:hypothetical protein BH10ACI1_BH10ACI1_26540 [soil metagenome]
MKVQEKFRKILASAFMACLLLIAAPTAFANFNIILPDNAQAQTGKTYGEWSATWWQYAMSIPADDNPILDSTGAKCRVGQSASSQVFFLASTPGGSVVRNECVVPAGKILFLPLLTTASFRSSDDKNKEPEHAIRNYLNGFIRSTRQIQVSIDGMDAGAMVSLEPHLTPLRAISPAGFFIIIAPENNIFGGVPGQSYNWVADGFYLLIAPLPPGAHTIKFGGVSRNFAADATYNLYVEP